MNNDAEFTCFSGVKGTKDEYRLLKTLWQQYDSAARPVNNVSDRVNVKMEVVLFQIRELVSLLLMDCLKRQPLSLDYRC